jgi:hypothetical protein
MSNQKNNPTAEFEADLEKDGFHIFSKIKNKIPSFYPSKFSDYELMPIEALKPDDRITIQAFFVISKQPFLQIDSGQIDLEIELIENDTIWSKIVTELPDAFPLAKGTTIALSIDEILYKHDEN